mgnify:CR=1 FL=1
MEDAIALVKVLNSAEGSVPERLARYQAEREIEALQRATGFDLYWRLYFLLT